jgi:extradiol dioxygenase family protein
MFYIIWPLLYNARPKTRRCASPPLIPRRERRGFTADFGKEPLTDADHIRHAMARFDQVIGVSDSDHDLAFANIKKAARHFGIIVEVDNWHQLGKKSRKNNIAHSS